MQLSLSVLHQTLRFDQLTAKMLPSPASAPRRNDITVNYIIRKLKPYRQKIVLGSIIFLFLFFFTNVFSSTSPNDMASDNDYIEKQKQPELKKAASFKGINPNDHADMPRLPESSEEVPFVAPIPIRAGQLAGRPRIPIVPKKSIVDERGCPEYGSYASKRHPPFSEGLLELPFQRPEVSCRTFQSSMVEQVIDDMNERLQDKDLARLFENCFPNTLDTTIRWHVDGATPQTFIVTGDINAEWLRDSQKQISPYLPLLRHDTSLQKLFIGAINVQVDYVVGHPYCNAFHPPPSSGIKFSLNNQNDQVYPRVNLRTVFECKYEIDSLASFLALSNDYFEITGDTSFVTVSWIKALSKVMRTISEQMISTFDSRGRREHSYYTFQRTSDTGTETLNLAGSGNPVNRNTSLIRSAFRPSDDATIYQYFIPGNAFMSAELRRTAKLLEKVDNLDFPPNKFIELADEIKQGIYSHGVYNHPVFGEVFAYEVDGYGSVSIMDDANTPSLLSLPDMGFVAQDDPIYLNTRRMILSKEGNPYYLTGHHFEGIGGPHIGTRFAWPMSHILAIRTGADDDEIVKSLGLLKNSTDGLGLMHESVNVDLPNSFTREWFSWCNSEFAKTLLYLAEHKPHLIFGENSKPYVPVPGYSYDGKQERNSQESSSAAQDE